MSSILERYPRVSVMTEAASTTEVRLSLIFPTVSPSSLLLISYKWIAISNVLNWSTDPLEAWKKLRKTNVHLVTVSTS